MSLDPAWLFLSLIVSGIGFVLFAYGKKSGQWQHMIGGLALMAYPYFVTTVPALLGVGAAIGIAIWYAVR